MKGHIDLNVFTYYDQHRISLPLSDALADELGQGLELSNDPMMHLLSSGGGIQYLGETLAYRKKVFKMRETYAKEIAETLTQELIKYFGRNDTMNGYLKD